MIYYYVFKYNHLYSLVLCYIYYLINIFSAQSIWSTATMDNPFLVLQQNIKIKIIIIYKTHYFISNMRFLFIWPHMYIVYNRIVFEIHQKESGLKHFGMLYDLRLIDKILYLVMNIIIIIFVFLQVVISFGAQHTITYFFTI